jgi:hypothetical protein
VINFVSTDAFHGLVIGPRITNFLRKKPPLTPIAPFSFLLWNVSSFPSTAIVMSGDKDIMAHEVGLDSAAQDARDMQRLGKVQQFKVGLGCGE